MLSLPHFLTISSNLALLQSLNVFSRNQLPYKMIPSFCGLSPPPIDDFKISPNLYALPIPSPINMKTMTRQVSSYW